MKNMAFAVCFAMPLVLFAARPSDEEMALYKACNYGAEAKECLRVVDQDGMPVAGARVWGGLQTRGDDSIPIRGHTDTNGEYVIQGKCTSRITCEITKDGYYDSRLELTNYGQTHTPLDGKWQPYGARTTIVLKEIMNPIALKHAPPNLEPPPSQGEWYGYDLEQRQWVTAGSEGLHPDMLVKITTDKNDETSDFKATLEVSFANNPCAGAYVLRKDRHSDMKSVYHADTNATYQTSFRFVYERHPVWVEKPVRFMDGVNYTDTRLAADSYLVFRTRTEVDPEGQLISAHYGKIYGLWEFFGGMRAANVQFNPTPNDTNLEDEETANRTLMNKREREERERYKKKRKFLWPF